MTSISTRKRSKGHSRKITSIRKIIWENYISNLFEDERPDFQNMADKKAIGPDCILVELLKLLDDKGIAVLQEIFNRIYDTGEFPAK